MVSFRKWTLALTGLAVFTGIAGAQTPVNAPLSCTTAVSVTPSLRSEGFTEQVGDITLNCTGGTALAPGSLIPQANVQIFFTQAVTSRLLPVTSPSSPNTSEALLLIDEPGSGLTPIVPGFGPAAPQTVCGSANTFASATISGSSISTTGGNPNQGCVAFVSNQAGDSLGQAVNTCQTANGNACTATSTTPAANIYQGIVSGNSVTFFGIPVLPPVTANVGRTFRITNIRVNAAGFGGGAGSAPPSVQAAISISGATSLLISNPNPVVGFVQNGLNQTATTATSATFPQCTSVTKSAVSVLTFAENFGTAFKTRVAAQTNSAFAGQINNPAQNVPGTLYQSESNLVISVPSGSKAGLADYGTRLKATITVPTGFTGTLWVSTQNVNNAASAVTPPTPPGGSAGNGANAGPFALLVSSETVSDGDAGSPGFFPQVSSTDTATGGVPIVQLSVVNGIATAVWEVVNTNPNALETLKFGVYVSFTSNVAQNNPPAPGAITADLSFAPTTTATPSASSTLTIPRFADSNIVKTLANFTICRTVLLYPYVTNQAGFDTGLAIANTSTDPFGTIAQAGTCTLSWFQGASNPADTTTPTVASGTVYVNTASVLAPGFQGYMIARCNFQFAHGFAFVSDVGAREIAMGYLALVLPDPGTSGRSASSGALTVPGTGEANDQ